MDSLLLGIFFPVLLPLLAALLWGLVGPIIKKSIWLSAITVCLTTLPVMFLSGIWATNELLSLEKSLNWFIAGRRLYHIDFLADCQAGTMLFAVALVSFMVQIFSLKYMENNRAYGLFFATLNLFTAAMNGLVLSNNLLFTFCCWEMMGFCSWLLISWHNQKPAAASANKAFILNRLADFGFIVLLVISFVYAQTFDYGDLNGIIQANQTRPWCLAAGLGLVLAVVGKSAQWPLQVWLPDAMVGPTPASALIHAATMVAAGVFLMFRLDALLGGPAGSILCVLGAFTALTAAFTALFQTDLKKVLAWSTISQLGFMMTAIGVGLPKVAFLHLIVHALFKAGLFLCAANIIHAFEYVLPVEKRQNMHFMGGLAKYLPQTSVCFAIFGLALAGTPLTAAFISKEMILDGVWQWAVNKPQIWGMAIPVMLILTVPLTACYILRVWLLVFGGGVNWKSKNGSLPHEPSFFMRLPIFILSFGAFYIVFSLNPLKLQSVLPAFRLNSHSNLLLSISSTGLAAAGAWFALRMTSLKGREELWMGGIPFYHFYLNRFYTLGLAPAIVGLGRKISSIDVWLLDGFLNKGAKMTVVLGHLIAGFDRYFIDGLVKFCAFAFRFTGNRLRHFAGINAQQYVTAAVAGLIIILWILIY